MQLHHIDRSNTELLRRILTLHDQMPLEWDPSHQPSSQYTEELIQKIQSSEIPQGFWILTLTETPSADTVLGILWANIKKDREEKPYCSINSLWIHPEYRQQKQIHQMTHACTEWAHTQEAQYLECCTHFKNTRMREILEKNLFEAGMVHYQLKFQ